MINQFFGATEQLNCQTKAAGSGEKLLLQRFKRVGKLAKFTGSSAPHLL